MSTFTETIVKGLVMGVFSALLGWVKNAKPGKFSVKGLIVKLPAGVVVGIVAASQGIEFTEALDWATGVGVIEVIDKLMKTIVRRFRPDWMSIETGGLEYDPALAETLMRLSEGKNITRDDVIRATELVRDAVTNSLDMTDPMDKEFRDHVAFVTNQVIQNVRKQGWSEETYENAGKMLFRLFQVWRKYRSDKTSMSPAEWAEEIKLIVTAMQAVFEATTD